MKYQLFECPHCGNKTQLEIIFSIDSQNEAYSTTNQEETMIYGVKYSLTKCTTCSDISLFANSELDENPEDISEAFLCYPHERKIDKDVPEFIFKNYYETKKVKKISKPTFVIIMRRGVEFLCVEQKAKGNTLKNKLEDLALRV